MKSDAMIRKDMDTHELECAHQVVRILFDKTGLTRILRESPKVMVGAGNWISFAVDEAISRDVLLGLTTSSGEPAFVACVFTRHGNARSRMSPSLHLTSLDSGGQLKGHVDSYYWARHLVAHAREFLRKKTMLPSEMLKRLKD